MTAVAALLTLGFALPAALLLGATVAALARPDWTSTRANTTAAVLTCTSAALLTAAAVAHALTT
ncbi:hypothetical protein [Streptomyces sp. WMMC897]|uniref:hypothetical protein n=1 Tax=Streptomyces sp. WMMC897 TaxID=3014782 RepID=UPI0022B72265|nr:hypothetical protein [Streptomyces sp. WMMC897]MCZ7413058.1 hypothetical protein [Streptomyces sp. WMMC897]MCZ7413146.1 hypothetical protein [Streptomyces sp. WMMC897]MCZ7415470.1 hypothetical protein [Streptomyces sp. WMMC897]